MSHSLRKLFVISALAALLLPLSASSAVPPVAIAATIAGFIWTGVNVLGIGARSAAVARADEIWVSDPPSITPADVDEGTLDWETAEWNRGRASSISIAPASAPSGNAITLRAETNWEQAVFSFSSSINVTDSNFENADGVLWGKGYAFGTFEGIVTREWNLEEQADPGVAAVGVRYTLSDITLPYRNGLDGTSLNIKLNAWKMDDSQTNAEESTWQDEINIASVSLSGPGMDYVQIFGDLNKNNFEESSSDDKGGFDIHLDSPIEREAVLHVPFPEEDERMVITFRIEVTGTVQSGKF